MKLEKHLISFQKPSLIHWWVTSWIVFCCKFGQKEIFKAKTKSTCLAIGIPPNLSVGYRELEIGDGLVSSWSCLWCVSFKAMWNHRSWTSRWVQIAKLYSFCIDTERSCNIAAGQIFSSRDRPQPFWVAYKRLEWEAVCRPKRSTSIVLSGFSLESLSAGFVNQVIPVTWLKMFDPYVGPLRMSKDRKQRGQRTRKQSALGSAQFALKYAQML